MWCDRLFVGQVRRKLALEKLTGGLFVASFSWNWALPVDLSHKVIEDLIHVDLALGGGLQEGAGVPLTGKADP